MSYLCTAVKKEVVACERFNNKADVLAYFEQKYGEWIRKKMEEKEKSLEHKSKYLDRKIEKESEDLEKQEELLIRQQEIAEEQRAVRRWLDGEDKKEAVYIKEAFEQYKTQLITEQEALLFRMAGIYKVCNSFIVTEEIHTYLCRSVTDVKDSLEALKKLPKSMTKHSYVLFVYEENPETMKQHIRQIGKIRAQIKRDYHKEESLLKNTGIFLEL